MNCLFCNIIKGDIESTFVYEDDKVIAFNDINPQAPVHILIVPKVHIRSNDDLDENTAPLVGHIFLVAKMLAKEYGLNQGYRIVNNCKDDGGQSVDHIHFHLLGKRKMLWPPG